MVLQHREQLFSTPCERLCPHMFLNWEGPLWRPWNPLHFDILCFLPTVSELDVFGCELELLNLQNQQPLPEAFRLCSYNDRSSKLSSVPAW